MLLILSCGTPVTGRTTTCNALREYFDSIGVSYQVFGKNNNIYYNKDAIKLNIYRWVVEQSSQVAIIDGVLLNYFDRKEIFDEVNHAKTISNVEVNVAAIQHNRTAKFSIVHNNDTGHYPYSMRTLIGMSNVYQQPLKIEGISVVQHIRQSNYLNLPVFIQALNDEFGYDFPVPETPEKEEIKDKEDVIEDTSSSDIPTEEDDSNMITPSLVTVCDDSQNDREDVMSYSDTTATTMEGNV